MHQTPRLLSVDEASIALGIGKTRVRALLNGELESVKIGVRRLIPADAIEEYIERIRQEDDRTP